MEPIKVELKRVRRKGKWVYVIILSVLLLALVFTGRTYAKKKGRINCSSFSTHQEAQSAFESDRIKYKSLDSNRDGVACETLQGN